MTTLASKTRSEQYFLKVTGNISSLRTMEAMIDLFVLIWRSKRDSNSEICWFDMCNIQIAVDSTEEVCDICDEDNCLFLHSQICGFSVYNFSKLPKDKLNYVTVNLLSTEDNIIYYMPRKLNIDL